MKILCSPTLPEYLLVNDTLTGVYASRKLESDIWAPTILDLIEECSYSYRDDITLRPHIITSLEPDEFLIDIPTFDDLFALPQTHPEYFL